MGLRGPKPSVGVWGGKVTACAAAVRTAMGPHSVRLVHREPLSLCMLCSFAGRCGAKAISPTRPPLVPP